MIARLDQGGLIDVDAPMPWTDIGTPTSHPGWADVTPRELLAHTSGMPVVRQAWFDGGLDCAGFLPSLLDRPPDRHTRPMDLLERQLLRARPPRRTRSPGSRSMPRPRRSCSIRSGRPASTSPRTANSPPTSSTGLGVERLSRLGGAGTFIVSTDDVAAMLAAVTPADLDVMTWPGVIIDQYGWGHTGTVDGALACAWVLEGGRTVVAATVAGRSPSTGGGVCDRVVPAVADDLGIGQGIPDRSPP